jgi:DNA processing protein
MPLGDDELEGLLRLALIQGVGPHRLAALVGTFGSADAVLRASPGRLRSVAGIGPELAGRILSAARSPGGGAAARAMRSMRRVGAFALTSTDPKYPPAFGRVVDPPYLLFGAGDLSALELESIAIVGTRSPTPYGKTAARQLSADLALAGYCIISGLARGIDSAAHEGALSVGAPTMAVLGHGIDQIYPPENKQLFDAVRENGLLLTEYSPGETPKSGNFPRRNRLIAALSKAVLVVEMGHQSGAQHTVGYALDQGKEVMAVPGSILSPASAGTNQLIKDGARLVVSAQDVLEELRGVGEVTRPLSDRHRNPAQRSKALPQVEPFRPPPDPSLPLLTPEEERLLTALGREALHVDELAIQSGRTAPSVLAALLHLELRGLVCALPGKRYARG